MNMVFVLELALRVFVFRRYFFLDPWNCGDAGIVVLGLLDAGASALGISQGKEGGVVTIFRMIRLLRILRIFKIVRFLKQLYLLAYGFAAAAQAIQRAHFRSRTS